jgi:GntR family transcriptional regulator, regulator for abcA and norABC
VDWRPDETSIQPIYWQIHDYFQKQILQGKLRPGDILPTERTLATMLGVNRSTVQTAYEELKASGLVQSRQGSGTRISEYHWDVSLVQSPDWERYSAKVAYRPSETLVRRLRQSYELDGLINLSREEVSSDLLPLEALKQLFTSFDIPHLGYSNPLGEKSLREAVAAHLQKTEGLRIGSENVLITSGSQQALHLITQFLLRPGDAVGLEQPSYAYSMPLFTTAGLKLCRIPTDEHGLIPDEVRTLYHRHRIRMIFVNPTYQNPTGTTLPEVRRRRLLEICGELRIPIVEEDPYAGLSLTGTGGGPPTLKAMYKPGGLLIYLGGFSKTAAPAFQVGWLVGPPKVIRRLGNAKDQMEMGVSTMLQSLAEQYLTSGEWSRHLGRLLPPLRERRDAMCVALQKYVSPFCRWNIPEGGYHIWCKLLNPVHDTEVLEAVIRRGVLITPGSVYGSEKGFARLTYAGQSVDQIAEGIRRFSLALTDLA